MRQRRVLPPEMMADPTMRFTNYEGLGGEELYQSDLRRARARAGLSADGTRKQREQTFCESFIQNHAHEIEMIRRGAKVESTIADELRKQGKPVLDPDDEHRPAVLVPVDGKKLPTLKQARRQLAWSRFMRWLRGIWRKVARLWTR